jgi:hypothetical protein
MGKFIDMGDNKEDERIDAIGKAAMLGNIVAFVTDDEPGKPERYIKKLKERFPSVQVIDQFKGPVAGTVSVKVQLMGE